MHAIRIDRARSLCEEPHLGHNRYHPDIEPILEVAPGRAFQVAQGTRATAQIPVSGVQPRTGLRHLQCRHGSAHQQCGRPAQGGGVRAVTGGDL